MEQIKVTDLSFAYKEAPDRLILKDINLEIASGEFVCLLGQSGCWLDWKHPLRELLRLILYRSKVQAWKEALFFKTMDYFRG